MSNPINVKTVNLPSEIGKKCTEKGVGYKTLIKNVNSKESVMGRMYESMPLLASVSRSLGFNFFELYTDTAELRKKISDLEAELSTLKRNTEKITIEHAIYKDTMEVLKRHITLPLTFDVNTSIKNEHQEV